MGNAVQSSYAFANCVVDTWCQKRKSNGFPALSIQWRMVSDVGHVAKVMGHDAMIAGIGIQRINSCLESSENILFSPDPVMASHVPADSKSFDSKTEDVLAAILHILCIKDTSKLNAKSTLEHLGLDSLMAIEIKHVLEEKQQD